MRWRRGSTCWVEGGIGGGAMPYCRRAVALSTRLHGGVLPRESVSALRTSCFPDRHMVRCTSEKQWSERTKTGVNGSNFYASSVVVLDGTNYNPQSTRTPHARDGVVPQS